MIPVFIVGLFPGQYVLVILVCAPPLRKVSRFGRSLRSAQREATPLNEYWFMHETLKDFGRLKRSTNLTDFLACFLAREPYRNEKIFIKDWRVLPPAERHTV